MIRSLMPLALAVLVISGCGREPTSTPYHVDSQDLSPVLLSSSLDPNLPSPGREALAVQPDDPVLARRADVTSPRPEVAGAANPVIYWNEYVATLGHALPPPLLARDYALVQVGIFDALVAAHDNARGNLDENAVAAGVAFEVLSYLFPGSAEQITADATAKAHVTKGDGPALGGWNLGRAVGKQFVKRGQRDGSDAVFTGSMPTGDGIWAGTNPVLPMAGEWQTWILTSGHQIDPGPPYRFGSPKDLADVNEVFQVSLARTPEMIAIVHKWADVSPPTIWNGVLNSRIESSGMTVIEAARASAYLNMTLADAFITCWACKYRFWCARPFQRIPGLVTAIPTPNFPSYTSGHATVSAASSVVLGEFFPDEADYFRSQAEEAAMSRLWGGIHFRHDNEAGLETGFAIGRIVVEKLNRNAKVHA